MKKVKRTTQRHEAVKPEPLFSDQWIAEVREHVKRLRDNGLDKPDRSFSRSAQLSFSHFCLAFIALHHLGEEERKAVMKEAIGLDERFGVSMFEKNSSVPRCLTKDHAECLGENVSLYVNGPIECTCVCHRKNS